MTAYNEDSIRSLDWKEHIRLRPGMYIGKLGDGSAYDDGIYVLLKEVVDNSIDEFVMGAGKIIDITVNENKVTVRDYGRGIPIGSVVDVVSKINTGGKYDSKAFQKSVGLNGVGTKAVNALSNQFSVQSYRQSVTRIAQFSKGELISDEQKETTQRNGTSVTFYPDDSIFKNYKYRLEFVENMIWNYVFLNSGLTINFNGQKFISENGLKDLLERNVDTEGMRYPIIHLKGDDIEIAMTHGQQYGEEYYSFVNGQHTTQGGTHQAAFREAVVKTIREFYKKEFDASDVRASIIGAIAMVPVSPLPLRYLRAFCILRRVWPGSWAVSLGGKDMVCHFASVQFSARNLNCGTTCLRQIPLLFWLGSMNWIMMSFTSAGTCWWMLSRLVN